MPHSPEFARDLIGAVVDTDAPATKTDVTVLERRLVMWMMGIVGTLIGILVGALWLVR